VMACEFPYSGDGEVHVYCELLYPVTSLYFIPLGVDQSHLYRMQHVYSAVVHLGPECMLAESLAPSHEGLV